MLKVSLILSAIAVIMANNITSDGKSNISVQVVILQDMDDFLKQNSQAQLINPEIPQDSKLLGQTRAGIQYKLGSRQSGDNLVGHDSGSRTWATPQNVRMTVSYPASGTGANITCVLIEVNQSSNLGKAYVIAGGIGYRNIIVVVEAQNTLWFNYANNIYGKF